MAYINITGDADGDLHTAELHNAKFGAIVGVLNGNVDHDNLKFPNSVSTAIFSAHRDVGDWCIPQDPAGSTTSAAAVLGYEIVTPTVLAANGVTNIVKSSIVRVHYDMTLTSVKFLYMPRSTEFVAGDECDLYLQRSGSLSSVFTNIASLENISFYNASAVIAREYTLSISSASIDAGQYIRFALRNDASNGRIPPYVSNVVLNFTTNTVA